MNLAMAGAMAGAAGTAALNATTYADIAMRGRPASTTQSDVVRKLAEKAEIEPLSKPDDQADSTTKNRRSGLGALNGYAIGLSMGVAYAAAAPSLRDIPFPVKGAALGALAMLAGDFPAASLGVTNLSEWGPAEWLSDIVPHMIYGMVTAAVIDTLASRR